jgi:predicted transcriptional regulator
MAKVKTKRPGVPRGGGRATTRTKRRRGGGKARDRVALWAFRQKLVAALSKPRTMDDLAAQLGAGKVTVFRSLRALDADPSLQLLVSERPPAGRGRPARLYQVVVESAPERAVWSASAETVRQVQRPLSDAEAWVHSVSALASELVGLSAGERDYFRKVKRLGKELEAASRKVAKGIQGAAYHLARLQIEARQARPKPAPARSKPSVRSKPASARSKR